MATSLDAALEHLRAHDPILAQLITGDTRPNFTPHTQYYQALVESIISQQLSVKASASIEKRFLALFPLDTFPSPEHILQTDSEHLRAAGLSRQKASYIQDLALKVIEGIVQFDQLDSLANDAIIQELTRIKGVGVWTVHMFLMFCMGRLDVLPIGDLGIRNGIQKLYGLDTVPTPDEVTQLARTNQWHPYESVASWYIWQALDTQPAIEVLESETIERP